MAQKDRSLRWHITQPLVGVPDEGFYVFEEFSNSHDILLNS